MNLYDINRYALVIRPTSYLLSWAIKEDPQLADDIDPTDNEDLATVFLLPEFSDMDQAEEWLEQNFRYPLENLLEEWVSDDSKWPDLLTFDHFNQYAEYTITDMVIDTLDAEYDEDGEDNDDDDFDDEDEDE